MRERDAAIAAKEAMESRLREELELTEITMRLVDKLRGEAEKLCPVVETARAWVKDFGRYRYQRQTWDKSTTDLVDAVRGLDAGPRLVFNLGQLGISADRLDSQAAIAAEIASWKDCEHCGGDKRMSGRRVCCGLGWNDDIDAQYPRDPAPPKTHIVGSKRITELKAEAADLLPFLETMCCPLRAMFSP
jgi:hypothetical protein